MYTDTPEGRFHLTVLSAVDEYERARTRLRSLIGKRAKAKAGKLTHSPGLYYGIQTSEKEMDPKEILDAYHNLWRIEESFRIMKSNLEVRPVFHWTERRIKGHFVSHLGRRVIRINLIH